MKPDNVIRFLRGEVQSHWTLIDSESVDLSNSDRDSLIDLLSTRYGFSRDRVAREIDRVAEELSEKLKLAA